MLECWGNIGSCVFSLLIFSSFLLNVQHTMRILCTVFLLKKLTSHPQILPYLKPPSKQPQDNKYSHCPIKPHNIYINEHRETCILQICPLLPSNIVMTQPLISLKIIRPYVSTKILKTRIHPYLQPTTYETLGKI